MEDNSNENDSQNISPPQSPSQSPPQSPSQSPTQSPKSPRPKKIEDMEKLIDMTKLRDNSIVLEGKAEIKKKTVQVMMNATKIWWTNQRGKLKRVVEWSSVAGIGTTHKDTQLVLHACPWKKKDSKIRVRKDYIFTFKRKDEIPKWKATMQYLVKNSEYKGLERSRRRLIVFINPFSGIKMGPKWWKEVEPLFKAADIETTVIETERKDHAHDYVRDTLKPEDYDGIVTVSGDGLMWEVINGIMQRPDWHKVLKLPVGIIAAGSGNAMACYLQSLNYLTSAMNIIKGYPRPLDLWKVTQKNHVEWAFVVVAWCIVSDVAMEAESRRWMGSVRFDVGALVSIAKFKKYPGRVSILPAEGIEKHRCSPHYGECKTCLPAENAEEKEYPSNAKDLPSLINHTDYANPPSNWKVFEDEFLWFICGNTTYLKPDMQGFPYAHIGDGAMDIVFSRKTVMEVSRGDLLKLLSLFENGEYVDHKAVEYFHAKALIMEPMNKEKSPGTFMVDGEPIDYDVTTVECYPRLATAFCQPPLAPN